VAFVKRQESPECQPVPAGTALRQREKQIRHILDSLFSFVGMMTPDGILIEANRTALEAAQLQPEDVLGKPFWDAYWWSFSPESQNTLRTAIDLAASGESVRYDVQVRLGAEHFIIIDFAIVPLSQPSILESAVECD
jgi:PAS domain-containing protein